MSKPTRQKHSYVNNKLLYHVVLIWKTLNRSNTEMNQAKVPSRVAVDIYNISKNLTKRWNFNGYSQDWKEEMFQDGIEVSITGIKNFNEIKYNNVFGYVSMACYNAFLQRIAKERREVATKYNLYIEYVDDEFFHGAERGVDEEFRQDIIDKLANYETKPKQQKQKKEDESSLNAFLI